ncbi:MAG TPA: hypothetical protein VGC61_01900 [Pyrinomonadaceae bacterium]
MVITEPSAVAPSARVMAGKASYQLYQYMVTPTSGTAVLGSVMAT